jgi:hypothetical protein
MVSTDSRSGRRVYNVTLQRQGFRERKIYCHFTNYYTGGHIKKEKAYSFQPRV